MAGMSINTVTAIVLLLAAPAAAAGSALAPACFQVAARVVDLPIRDGLDICGSALRDRHLSARDRGATLVNRGVVKLHAKRYAAAVADFDAALAVAPDLVEAMVNKGIALIEAGRPADAVVVLDAAIAAVPDRATAWYARAMANEEAGATRAAYEDYVRAAALAPDWAEPAEQLKRFTVVRRVTARG